MTPSKLLKRLRIDDPDGFRLASLEQVRAALEAEGGVPADEPNKRRSQGTMTRRHVISYRHLD